MTAVIARYTLLDGKADEFQEIVKKLIEPTRKEKGCIFYECARSNDDPQKFVMMENWESREALDEHFKAPHFVELVPKMRALLAERTVEIFTSL